MFYLNNYLKRNEKPLFNVAKALFSSTKNYYWKAVSQKGVMGLSPINLIAKASVTYFCSTQEITHLHPIQNQSPLGILKLHEYACKSMIETILGKEERVMEANMMISDHFYGETSYTLVHDENTY